MSRLSYRMLIGLFALLSLSGVLATLVVSWKNQQAPEEVDCRAWVARPREGHLRLTRCGTIPIERSGIYSHVLVGWSTTDRYEWKTRDGEMMRLTDPSREGRRALARHLASRVERDVMVDAVRYGHAYDLRDPRKPVVSIWVGVIPFFVFGIPLFWLVRKQRKWRAERIAWERSRGVVTEGDKPTAF